MTEFSKMILSFIISMVCFPLALYHPVFLFGVIGGVFCSYCYYYNHKLPQQSFTGVSR